MHTSATTTNRQRLFHSDLVLLALEIAIPVGVVDLIGGVMSAGRVSALSIVRARYCDWASAGCAVWALLVLNRGPFRVARIWKSRAKE